MSQINKSLDIENINKDLNNLIFNSKNNDKNISKETNIINKNLSNQMNQNSLKKNNSFNIKERKIISIIGISKVPKEKKIKFNDLPDLCLNNHLRQNISKKDMNNISEKKEEELNSEEIINEENDEKNNNKLGINCEQMYKELIELKNENNIIKNKLEELSNNQKNQIGDKRSKENNNINYKR